MSRIFSTQIYITNPTAFATNTMLGATNPLDTTNPEVQYTIGS